MVREGFFPVRAEDLGGVTGAEGGDFGLDAAEGGVGVGGREGIGVFFHRLEAFGQEGVALEVGRDALVEQERLVAQALHEAEEAVQTRADVGEVIFGESS